jgi:hypothetical protein
MGMQKTSKRSGAVEEREGASSDDRAAPNMNLVMVIKGIRDAIGVSRSHMPFELSEAETFDLIGGLLDHVGEKIESMIKDIDETLDKINEMDEISRFA